MKNIREFEGSAEDFIDENPIISVEYAKQILKKHGLVLAEFQREHPEQIEGMSGRDLFCWIGY